MVFDDDDDDDDNEEIEDDGLSAIVVVDEDASPMINKLKSLFAEMISIKKPLTAINNNKMANITINVPRIIIKNECRPIAFITLFGSPGNGLFGDVWVKVCVNDNVRGHAAGIDSISHLFFGKH